MAKVYRWWGMLGRKDLREKYADTIHQLLEGDYKGADLQLKRFKDVWVFTAKGNKKARLIFTTVNVDGKPYLYLVDDTETHDYSKVSFIRNGGKLPPKEKWLLDTGSWQDLFIGWMNPEAGIEDEQSVKVVPASDRAFYRYYLLDLTELQRGALHKSFPLAVMGPAGSGKSCVGMEWIKALTSDADEATRHIVYLAESDELRRDMQENWESVPLANRGKHQVKFFSYENYLRSHLLLAGKTLTNFDVFQKWFVSSNGTIKHLLTVAGCKYESLFKKPDLVYQALQIIAFHASELLDAAPGVYDDAADKLDKALLDILSGLGELQFRFSSSETHEQAFLVALYHAYQAMLVEKNCVDLSLWHPVFPDGFRAEDYIIYDEASDLAPLHLKTIKHMAKAVEDPAGLRPTARMVCFLSDNRQSLENNRPIGPMLELLFKDLSVVKLQGTYRCPERCVEVVNAFSCMLLKAVGKTDTDDYEEIQCATGQQGEPTLFLSDTSELDDIIHMHRENVQFAVVVSEEKLEEARRIFGRERVYTIKQIRGLEFETVLLYDLLDPQALSIVNDRVKSHADKGMGRARGEDAYSDAHVNGNEFFTAATRPTKQLLVYQKNGRHKLKAIITALEAISNIQIDQYNQAMAERGEGGHSEIPITSSVIDWVRHGIARYRSTKTRDQGDAIFKKYLGEDWPSVIFEGADTLAGKQLRSTLGKDADALIDVLQNLFPEKKAEHSSVEAFRRQLKTLAESQPLFNPMLLDKLQKGLCGEFIQSSKELSSGRCIMVFEDVDPAKRSQSFKKKSLLARLLCLIEKYKDIVNSVDSKSIQILYDLYHVQLNFKIFVDEVWPDRFKLTPQSDPEFVELIMSNHLDVYDDLYRHAQAMYKYLSELEKHKGNRELCRGIVGFLRDTIKDIVFSYQFMISYSDPSLISEYMRDKARSPESVLVNGGSRQSALGRLYAWYGAFQGSFSKKQKELAEIKSDKSLLVLIQHHHELLEHCKTPEGAVLAEYVFAKFLPVADRPGWSSIDLKGTRHALDSIVVLLLVISYFPSIQEEEIELLGNNQGYILPTKVIESAWTNWKAHAESLTDKAESSDTDVQVHPAQGDGPASSGNRRKKKGRKKKGGGVAPAGGAAAPEYPLTPTQDAVRLLLEDIGRSDVAKASPDERKEIAEWLCNTPDISKDVVSLGRVPGLIYVLVHINSFHKSAEFVNVRLHKLFQLIPDTHKHAIVDILCSQNTFGNCWMHLIGQSVSAMEYALRFVKTKEQRIKVSLALCEHNPEGLSIYSLIARDAPHLLVTVFSMIPDNATKMSVLAELNTLPEGGGISFWYLLTCVSRNEKSLNVSLTLADTDEGREALFSILTQPIQCNDFLPLRGIVVNYPRLIPRMFSRVPTKVRDQMIEAMGSQGSDKKALWVLFIEQIHENPQLGEALLKFIKGSSLEQQKKIILSFNTIYNEKTVWLEIVEHAPRLFEALLGLIPHECRGRVVMAFGAGGKKTSKRRGKVETYVDHCWRAVTREKSYDELIIWPKLLQLVPQDKRTVVLLQLVNLISQGVFSIHFLGPLHRYGLLDDVHLSIQEKIIDLVFASTETFVSMLGTYSDVVEVILSWLQASMGIAAEANALRTSYKQVLECFFNVTNHPRTSTYRDKFLHVCRLRVIYELLCTKTHEGELGLVTVARKDVKGVVLLSTLPMSPEQKKRLRDLLYIKDPSRMECSPLDEFMAAPSVGACALVSLADKNTPERDVLLKAIGGALYGAFMRDVGGRQQHAPLFKKPVPTAEQMVPQAVAALDLGNFVLFEYWVKEAREQFKSGIGAHSPIHTLLNQIDKPGISDVFEHNLAQELIFDAPSLTAWLESNWSQQFWYHQKVKPTAQVKKIMSIMKAKLAPEHWQQLCKVPALSITVVVLGLDGGTAGESLAATLGPLFKGSS